MSNNNKTFILTTSPILKTKTQLHSKDNLLLKTQAKICFSGHFPGGPGLSGNRMSPFWVLLELRMMEVVVTAAAIRRAMAAIKMSQPTNQHPNYFLQGGRPSCRPANSVSTEGKCAILLPLLFNLIIYKIPAN